MANVEILPSRTTIPIREGQSLFQALMDSHLPLMHDCGGAGVCGKCKVKIHQDSGYLTDVERRLLSPEEIENNVRLACAYMLRGDEIVELFLVDESSIFDPSVAGVRLPVDPWPESKPDELAIAFDIGTTNVTGYLLDPGTGVIINAASRLNSQALYGSDVMSRLMYASHHGNEARETLRALAVSDLEELAAVMNTPRKPINYAVAVMNAALTTFIAGEDPDKLGRYPCESHMDSPLLLEPFERRSLAGAPLRIPPVIGGFVGSDALSALIATLDRLPASPFVLVDIGTNTEVILVKNSETFACSAPAGPAFEGYGIKHGMRAMNGAIIHATLADDTLVCETIGNMKPQGIAGSGLFSIFAELLTFGVLDTFGAVARDRTPARMIRDGKTGPEVVIADEVTIDGRDIQQFMVAKAATRAALDTLMRHSHTKPEELTGIYFAGAFAQSIEPAHLITVGIVPDIGEDRIVAIGNAAGMGAARMAASRRLFYSACEKARQIQHLPLSNDPYFKSCFLDNINFFP